jgi:glutaredoxin
MKTSRKIEIFSAGCAVCEDAITLVKELACASCEVEIRDMRQADVAAQARQYGIRSVPAIVIDGKLADCCTGRGVEKTALQAAGIGVPLP